MTTLCNRHKPKCFADITGQEIAIQKIKFFFQNFPEKKAIILNGTSGTGKTSIVYALAFEKKLEILEINASFLRNREQIEKIIGNASQQNSLFGKSKLLLVDEVDGLSHEDKGGLDELIKLIDTTKFPIIITSNNIYDRKFSELRRKAEIIELKELDYNLIFNILKDISLKEKFNFNDDLLKAIAIKARGDVRAAINDLQTLTEETKLVDLHERDKEEKIFDILQKIFKNLPNNETLNLYDKTSLSLDDIYLWLEENIHLEYKDRELFKAYEALSKADVFRGRIIRQQYWRFLVYQTLLLSAGVSAAKQQARLDFTKYNRPERMLKIWLYNQKIKTKKSIAEKFASYCHIGKKRAMQNFEITKNILKNPVIQEQLKLNEEEREFLKS